ncbi:Cysteine desulfurase IscS [bacterium HR35]|nr:Cysteine desulfurase IscS [bacterium HR35]
MREVYLDYAATTPLRKEAREAMEVYFQEIFANPVSLHSFGQKALKAVDEARNKIKEILNADDFREIIFTASSTEANNYALKGLVFYFYFKANYKKVQIITSSIEHPSVLDPLADLENLEIAEVIYLAPEKNGLINPQSIIENLKENTVLVSLHYINSELGNRQKVEEIGNLLEKINKQRERKIFYHLDAAQAGLTEELDVKKLKCDLMTLSSHKIYGPKGIAALYLKLGTPLLRLISGSGHEFDLRGGTEAVPLIVGFAKAFELAYQEREKNKNHFIEIRDYFLKRLQEEKITFEVNTNLENSSPKILNLYFPSKTAEEIFLYLDLNGVYVSPGTACKSRSAEPSYMVAEVFKSKERAKRSLRFSFGLETNFEDIDYLVSLLKKIL